MPYLRALSSFRDEVRKLALKGASSKEILELCDRLRDNELVDLGVALDDQEGACLYPRIPLDDFH
jgi:cysteinyl-tRNA synthetase